MAFNGALTKRKEHKWPLRCVLFVIFSAFGDIFLTFPFFWRRRLTTREESPHFVQNHGQVQSHVVITKSKWRVYVVNMDRS